MRHIWCSLLYACIAQISSARELPYQSISNIRQLETSLQANSLVVFDIDLTLLVPSQAVAMPQWVSAREKHLLKIYSDKSEAYDRLAADFSGVYNLVSFRPAEKDTAKFLESLNGGKLQRKKSYDTLALTARGFGLIQATRIHLKDNDLKFSGHFIENRQPQFFNHQDLHNPIALDRGVVYSSGQHKGMVLEKVITATNYPLKHLIFIDDEPHNLYKMAEVCGLKNWNCSLFHYAGTIEEVKRFDLDIANSQWEQLKRKIRPPRRAVCNSSKTDASAFNVGYAK